MSVEQPVGGTPIEPGAPVGAHGPAAAQASAQTDAVAGTGGPRHDTIVVGGGIAGLVAAHDLAGRGYRVLLLEAADRLGGTASRIELPLGNGEATLALDAGAESFAVRGGAVAELLDELDLADDIVDPDPAGAWLVLPAGSGVRAVPLPKQTLLGIPAVPLAQDVIDAIGWSGALRAHLDRLMPVLRIGKDDTLGPLVRRRMGTKVLDRLVAPLAGGVYSADPELLEVDTVAPGLNNGITRTGSLSGGVAFVLEERAAAAARAGAGQTDGRRPGSAVQGVRGGIHRIAERLGERAREHRAALRTGERVTGLTPTGSGWVVTTDAGSHAASSVVVALPEAAAHALLAPLAPAPAGIDAVVEDTAGSSADDGVGLLDRQRGDDARHPIELVTLVFPRGAIEGVPRGTGVLVAADATAVRAKAMTHATAKWAWLREAAAGREVVRLSYGTGDEPAATASLDDAAAAQLALADARAIFGTALPEPLATARVRWAQGQPSAGLGAREHQQALRDIAAAHEQLLVVGAAVAGTGLAQVVPDARHAVLEVRRERFAEPGTPWTDELEPEDASAPDDVDLSGGIEGSARPGDDTGEDPDETRGDA